MRRIWAHIIIAITTFVMAFVTFTAVTNNLNVGLEYGGGKTLTFQVTERTISADGESINSIVSLSTEDSDYNSAEDVAAQMEDRLNEAEVDKYTIEVFGQDIIKVTLSQPDIDYSQISQYLAFNGSLSLNAYGGPGKDDYVKSEAFLNKNKPAYLTGTQTVVPTINIPVDVDNESYKRVLKAAFDSDPVLTEEGNEEQGTEDQYAKFMYLVYDFIPGIDTFEDQDSVGSKVLLSFQISDDEENPITYYEESDGTYSLSTPLNVVNEEGQLQREILAQAWKSATYYVNLLNAGAYDYDVTLIHSANAEPQVESLFTLGKNQTVFGSSTFIAFACALIIVSLILVIFYKLGALSISTTTFASVFLSLLFLSIVGSEFNMMTLVGLILVGFASLVSGIIYCNKFKDEVYHGRSMKKANTEASKKSNLPIVDVHFVLVALGAFGYLIGGSLLKGFALVTVLGGLVSLILNLIAFKGFMWLDTNASCSQGKFAWFGVDTTKIPTLINEEKQSYFGPYANKEFTKKSKPFGIAFGALFGVLLASMIVFGCVKSSVYDNSSKDCSTEIYFKVDKKETTNLYTINDLIQNTLSDISFDEAGSNAIKVSTPEIEEYTITEYDTVEGNYERHEYATFIVEVDSEIADSMYYKGSKVDAKALFDSKNDAVTMQGLDNIMEYELVTSRTISNDQPNAVRVIIATAAALGTCALYFLLRYRLSRGLALFITSVGGATILGGLFALLRFVPIGNYGAAGIILGAFMTLVFGILFANKERELILDDKKHDNSIENREVIMKNAVSYGFGDSLNVAIVGLYLGINFFGFGPRSFSWISILIILGVALAFAVSVFITGPLSHKLYKSFANARKEKPQKVRKNKPIQQKSAEPEEAIFIGIND